MRKAFTVLSILSVLVLAACASSDDDVVIIEPEPEFDGKL